MLGTLRLLLAVSVAVFHANLGQAGLRYGVSAVVIFYMISGYAMSGLAGTFLAAPSGGLWRGAARFWRDRALRLYPQYFAWLVIAAIVRFGLGRVWLGQLGPPDWINAVSNVTVAPLSLYMYVPSIRNFTLIPQAWSLSTELGFYAMFPLIWQSRAANWAAAIGGCAVLGLATFNILSADDFAYRLLPGTLPFFLIGRALFRRDHALLAFLATFLLADFAAIWATGYLPIGYNREILAAALAGPPALALAVRLRPWRFDTLAGHASYGAYLAHVVVILLALGGITSAPERAAAAALLSAGAGLAGYLAVEKPVNRYRRWLRRREQQVT